jgi:hypothetical protein
MRVRFLRAYDYTPSAQRRVTIGYAAGFEGTVKRECGEAAVAAGAAEEVPVFNGADPAAFDHDADGRAGGSKPRARRR